MSLEVELCAGLLEVAGDAKVKGVMMLELVTR
jgi:hypothetical protein